MPRTEFTHLSKRTWVKLFAILWLVILSLPTARAVAQLFASNRAGLLFLPLRSSGTDAVRKKIQAGSLCVHHQARSDRGQERPQFQSEDSRSLPAFCGV